MTLNPMDLAGKRFLVTGASSGIGRDTAIHLSRLNATLAITGQNEDRLGATLAALQGHGHIARTVDLSDLDALIPWFQSVVAQTGPLNGFVHAAGIQITTPIRAVAAPKIDSLLRINVSSALLLTRAFCDKKAYATPSSIVFVSSVMSVTGSTATSLYSASKGALLAMARSLAVELARNRIRVNCVSPAFVQTAMIDQLKDALLPEQFAAIEAMHPLGLGTTIDVANAIAFLLSDAAGWITGTGLIVDGGYTAH